ncbi:hypothetical protein S7335_5436 [Synechococcus sp. PCC 7335]|nr:hypothetical protein S7335_5436 [Synechococcus sp. PCC 7335]
MHTTFDFTEVVERSFGKSMSSIRSIVEQALQDGYLTPAMEAEVARICDTASELSVEEYTALDQLMSSLLTGEVVAVPRKQFINVMEELVLTEAISQVAQAEGKTDKTLDLGDVAAYALNRLPPLYATTEEGADYQRENARAELTELIAYQVSESVGRSLDQPEFFPERKELQRSEEFGLLGQVNQLLKDYARDFEQAPKVA